MKNCSNENCSQQNPQPYSEFYKNKDGFKARCKSCLKVYDAKLYKKNPELLKARAQRYRKKNSAKVKNLALQWRYGISLDQYHEMLKAQNNCCAVCQTLKPGGNSKKYFYVDHSHKTGKVRGLLCYHCNLALGMLKDNPKAIDRLVEYVARHEEK
jgi:hypothetical protein